MIWILDFVVPFERHVVPLNDLREHESSRSCWCRPRQDEECGHVWIHDSMDGREFYERGERVAS